MIIPLCEECGRPINMCICEEEKEEWDEDWGAGEVGDE